MLVVFARVVLLSVRLYSCNYAGLEADRSCRPAGREVYSRSAWRYDNLLDNASFLGLCESNHDTELRL